VKKKEENKSNDLPSQHFYFPIFFIFCYVVLQFEIIIEFEIAQLAEQLPN
jgi:hypothetical protein